VILDSSAVVAVVLEETGYEALRMTIRRAASVGIGAPTLLESELVLTGRMGEAARAQLLTLVTDGNVAVLSFDEEHWREAGSAFLRYGKGRHPAGLNYGDCMTYATARLAREPLLCLGNDFAQTDLELA